ncbi:MAG: cytochrome oxidase [Gammaproteobacteria bacterium]|nr:cytochrome oxidase [Gammaproteobacteria bacterium]
MSLTVAFVALLAGVVVWGLLARKLTAKPWERSAAPEEIEAGSTAGLPPAKIGLWALLAVVTSLFGLFISAYYMRMEHAHGDWTPLAVPRQLWVNTALLVLSSAAMEWARGGARRAQMDRLRTGLTAGGVLAWAFLAGQLLAWRQLSASGYFVASNPAVAFFYLLTAVHGLHLLGGLFVWGKTVFRMARPGVELVDLRLSVELCTVYWHYLLLVWLVLFAVLLST